MIWICTNNATKYEALCLGIKQEMKMKIKWLIIFGDLNLINQVKNKYSLKYHYMKKY